MLIEDIPWPRKAILSAAISPQDVWLLTYAAWYGHFLGMQPDPPDHLSKEWANRMVEATIMPSWMKQCGGDPDPRLATRFARLQEAFKKDLYYWLARTAECSQQNPDPEPRRSMIQADAPAKKDLCGKEQRSVVQIDLFA